MAEEILMLSDKPVKEVTFRLLRFDPRKDQKPYLQDYQVPVTRGMTVLEALVYIKEHLDGSISFRASCRMGVCGSCGMFISGLPRLACQTQVLGLTTAVVEIRPLPNYRIIKDLVPDLEPMFAFHKRIKPYVIRHDGQELEQPSGEFMQTPAQQEEYLQFAYCLKCGICLAACPTVASDRYFFGPQALAQVYRYTADNRDDAKDERFKEVAGREGPWRCHLAGACSQACPKGVDPALGIQLLKRKIAGRSLGMGKRKEVAKVAPPQTGDVCRQEIPRAPEPTVK